MGDALLYLLSNCFSSLVISIFLTYIVYQKPDVLFWESYTCYSINPPWQYNRQTTSPFLDISSNPVKFAKLPSALKVYRHSPFTNSFGPRTGSLSPEPDIKAGRKIASNRLSLISLFSAKP